MFLKNTTNFSNFIDEYKNYDYVPYDFESDGVGIVKLIDNYLNFTQINFKNKTNAFDLSLEVCREFKTVIESTGMYDPFVGRKGKVVEKQCPDLFYLYACKQFITYNYDFSPECNKGRGPADFKISLGNNDKCIIEAKLLSNDQYLHGIETQIIEYAKAECCKKIILGRYK